MKRLSQALVIASIVALPLVGHAADTSYGSSTGGSSAASKRVMTIDTRADRHPVPGNLYAHR
ncbi:hypothetical protein [Paraburkholderia humisilvae]|uniref:Uncharacterized protein n=1 Tax=Paraburkholderia humisilvae TaxID=627669 RepID=A0A6J5DU45_9BURK|nr:hypothetical protein [Paraburkholderia humisilvae]CAB3756405.1 hypothetical protein LMG29542_02857 [Paraburkholderia humisilvae]